jgi:GxxExxY protein
MDGDTGVTEIVIGAAIAVHRALGPGLLESTYEACLVYELAERGVAVERQKSLPVDYRGVRIDCGYRIDLLVGNEVIVELKAVERLLPLHEAQLLTYLRLSGLRVGLLLNFNVLLMKEGVRRMVREAR